MAYYRLYFFDRFSGHIEHFREFEAPGDASAVAQSAGWRELNAMELWCGNRKVTRWEALALDLGTRNTMSCPHGRDPLVLQFAAPTLFDSNVSKAQQPRRRGGPHEDASDVSPSRVRV